MRTSSLLLLTATAFLPAPAFAQSSEDLARQLTALQAEMARLSAQIATLQAQQEQRASAETPAAVAPPPAQTDSVAWKGAPEVTGEGGWSFKPRGRLQVDSAYIDAPEGIPGDSLGLGTEFRRAYVGLEGTLPGGFGYRMEADVADSDVQLTDVFLTYKATKELTLTVGQHKPFQGLEDSTSDLFTSMLERAAFSSAFGFERRVGLSGTYASGDLLLQLGAFADNAADLNADSNNSRSFDGRVVLSPKMPGGLLHIGASAHFRELNDAPNTVRYRARPFVHTPDLRLVDTRAFSGHGERSFGAELAYIAGPLHVTVEGHRLTALRGGLPDPTFWGGYAEIGLLVTPGDTTAYRGGAYDRIRPANPVSEGGIGAIQLNARFDRLDLNDRDIMGGRQDALGLSAIWIPSDYVRFILNYGHLWLSDAAVSAAGDTDYQLNTVGLRAQVDF